ncbi:MAG: asparagine synthase C-terminal domain-containing protein [Candidatus Thermoplasmatota archaeon]|nr:asparagine synthase C-terminal domain-containing protein [Candidatus Thermoplasmatota archaeon]
MLDSATLLNTIERAVESLVRQHRTVGVAYSGGLDSSVIAALASRHAEATCYSACVKGSHDAEHVQAFAHADGFDVKILELTDDNIQELARLARSVLLTSDPVRISYTIPTLRVIESAVEPAILVGSIADEIFAGYAKYESSDNVSELMVLDLEKALHEIGLLSQYAEKGHAILLAPYADTNVIGASSQIPLEDKLGPEGRKLILRECANMIGLEASTRPKKAAQYSSGVSKAMQRLAKAEGETISEWVLGI